MINHHREWTETKRVGSNTVVKMTVIRDERGLLECPITFSGSECIHGTQKEEFLTKLNELLNEYGGV
jgi:hypothetical protein